MIRYLKDQAFVPGKNYIEAAGLSTDQKPVSGFVTGSRFLEVDTGKVYEFDEVSSTWTKVEDFDGDVVNAVAAWLEANVDPDTGYVLDRTLTQSNAATPADITGDLKSAIGPITGNDIIQFTQGKYIRDNYSTGTVVDYTNPSTGSSTNYYAVVDASPGDQFTINGTGGNQGRLWCFVDSSKKLITVADANATATNLLITAPANADKLILNVNGAHGANCRGVLLSKTVGNIENNIVNTALNDENNWISGKYINEDGEYTSSTSSISMRVDIKLDDISSFSVGTLPSGASGYYYMYSSSGDFISPRRAYASGRKYLVENLKTLYPTAYAIRLDLRSVSGDTSKCSLFDFQYKTNTTTKLLKDNLNPYIKLSKSDFVNGTYSDQMIDTSRSDIICTRFMIPVYKGDAVRFVSENLSVAIGMYVGDSMSIVDATGWIDASQNEYEYICKQDGFVFVYLKKSSGNILPSEYDADIRIYNTLESRARRGENVEKLLNANVKTVAFLGDSLTAGVGTNYIYHMYLADRFGWHCKNYGYGGSGYAISYSGTGGKMATGQEGMGDAITNSNKFTPNDFYTRIQTISTSIDALVIFGGTNDWGYNATMTDFNTALDNVFSYAQTTFGMKPIIVMLPCHRLDDDTQNTAGNTLQDYIDAIVAKCRKYGIICIDTLAESGLNPSNNTNKTDFFTRDDNGNIDGVHPNHYAHKMISNLVAPVIMNKLY